MSKRFHLWFIFLLPLLALHAASAQQNLLPSWKNGSDRRAIINFVHDVTDPQSCQFVPPKQRIATFDFDGTIAGETSAKGKHPEYVGRAFEPMREVVAYLRANGFTCWIVSGSSEDRLKKYAAPNYGITDNHLIGSVGHDTKVTAIKARIGVKPIFAAGNNGNDYAMLRYSHQQPRETLQLLIHHDDAAREVNYAQQSEVDAAKAARWRLISIKKDWRRVFWKLNQSQ